MNETDASFVRRAIRRRQAFSVLSVVGVIVGGGLLVWSTMLALAGEPASASGVIAILVLLNARQNLRQSRYARILESLVENTDIA